MATVEAEYKFSREDTETILSALHVAERMSKRPLMIEKYKELGSIIQAALLAKKEIKGDEPGGNKE